MRLLRAAPVVFAMSLFVPLCAQAFSVRTVDLKVRDLAYNPADGLLYVTVPGLVPGLGNTVTLIDPATAAIVGSIPVGSEPSTLALSRDGSALYVGLTGASLVQRINTASRAIDLEIPLPNGTYGAVFAGEMAVMPGHPHTFAVALRYAGSGSGHAGITVFDDATARPVSIVGFYRSNQITFGSRDDRLYGLNTETTEYGFRKFLIDANGISEISVTPDFIPGWHGFGWFDGRIYSDGGRVIEPETPRILGTFPLTFDDYDRSVAPDTNITYFVSNRSYTSVTLSRFDTRTFAFLDRRRLRDAFDAPTGAVRWGAHGLAYFTFDFFSETGRVYVLDGIDDPPNADLAMTVRETADPSAIGDYLTYEVILRNLGPDDAADVQLDTDFAGGYPLVYSQSPRGNCFGGETRTCRFGTVVVGDSVTASFTFQPDREGTLTFHAVASSSINDATPANNEVTETTSIVPRPAQSDLFFDVRAESTFVTVGQTSTVVVDIGNRGGAPALSTRLVSEFGGGGQVVRVDGIENPAGTCEPIDAGGPYFRSRCELGSIAPGAHVQVRFRVTALAVGDLYGSFQATSTSPESTPYDNYAYLYLPVRPSASSLVDSLSARVSRLSLKVGAAKHLQNPLDDALASLAASDDQGACAALREFENTLNQQVGKALSIPVAYSLLAECTMIREFLDCDPAVGRHFAPAMKEHVSAAVTSRSAFEVESSPAAANPRVWFELAKAGRAKLRVFDVRGRVVATLADGSFEAGRHELVWDGPKAGGVYFFRFEPEGSGPLNARGVIVP